MWEAAYPIDFTPDGDRTNQAIGKHINEIEKIYGHLNDLSATKEDKSEATEAPKVLRQLDLYVPGKFAAETTNTALQKIASDFSTWELEDAKIKLIKARCIQADSGATPASVRLVINGSPVGPTLNVVASTWTAEQVSELTFTTGDAIEIAVTATGTNMDSEGLRLTVLAEV